MIIMKKFISVLSIAAIMIGMIAVSMVGAGAAAEPAQTIVDVKEGDKVSYTLTLGGVAEKIIGCDFSFYYDPDIFTLDSIADFNDETDPDKWTPLINPDLVGEVRGNWSILSGVDFSKDRHFLTMNLTAKKAGSAHLSYFLRYLYDNNIFNSTDKPQITEYKMTCDVLVNGEKILEKAQPELNTTETQKTGLFVNSVTGDSKDADPDIPGTVVKKNNTNSAVNNGGSSAVNNNQNNNTPNNNTPNNTPNNTATTANGAAATAAPAATTADGAYITATDAQGNVTATSDQPLLIANNNTPANTEKKGGSPALWIVIGVIVLLGGGICVYYVMKRKNQNKAPEAPAADAPVFEAEKTASQNDSEKTE